MPRRLPLTLALLIAGCEGGVIQPGRAPGPSPGTPATAGNTVVQIGPTFDPKDNGSTGVKVDKSGGLVLDPGNFASTRSPIIWIANSDEGTISKIETRTMTELARYITAPGLKPDPSRSTVSLLGDVVIANRAGSSATRIAASRERCIDKNGNGAIDTSTGPADVKPWGEDECVLWHTPFTPGSLGRTAVFDNQLGPDGDDSSTVWIGLYNAMEMKQLDARTGAVLATVDVAPIRPYGGAIDREGNIWVRGGMLAKIDRQHNVTKYSESACGYGLAVDAQGRPWTAGGNCVSRLDPATRTWETATVGEGFHRGMAIDNRGSVWIASTSFGVYQVDTKTMQLKKALPMPYTNFVGVAVDFDGMIWVVSQGSSVAVRIDPDTYEQKPMQVGDGPYTYSDMTGFQLRNTSPPLGRFRHVVQGCDKETSFAELAWQATTPPGTLIAIKARVGADAKSLAATPWTQLAKIPASASPLKLADKLPQRGALLELDLTLHSASDTVTPTLHSLSLTMSCFRIG